MKNFNGHRSWNAWNVSLWICNDESLYRLALECIEEAKINGKIKMYLAVNRFLSYIDNKTPDGAIYNKLSVKLALQGLIE
jgi:hypothetical protein